MKKIISLLSIATLGVAVLAQAQEPAEVEINTPPAAPRTPSAPRPPRPPAVARALQTGMSEELSLVNMLNNPTARKRLQLTTEQSNEITEGLRDFDQQAKDTEPALAEALKNQADLVKDDNATEAAVLAAVDAVWKLRAEMAKVQTKKFLFIKSKLMPEQLKIASEMAEELQGRFRGIPMLSPSGTTTPRQPLPLPARRGATNVPPAATSSPTPAE